MTNNTTTITEADLTEIFYYSKINALERKFRGIEPMWCKLPDGTVREYTVRYYHYPDDESVLDKVLGTYNYATYRKNCLALHKDTIELGQCEEVQVDDNYDNTLFQLSSFMATKSIETIELQGALMDFYTLALKPDMYLGDIECDSQTDAERQLAILLNGLTASLKKELNVEP